MLLTTELCIINCALILSILHCVISLAVTLLRDSQCQNKVHPYSLATLVHIKTSSQHLCYSNY